MSRERECPECGCNPLDVTANGDNERQFLCGGLYDDEGFLIDPGCGHTWSEPFPEVDERPPPWPRYDPQRG